MSGTPRAEGTPPLVLSSVSRRIDAWIQEAEDLLNELGENTDTETADPRLSR